MSMKTILVAAVALIDQDNRILLAKRPEGKAMAGLWEFPGGKVEQDELPEAALMRELHEELGIDVAATSLHAAGFVSHVYEKEAGVKAPFHLLMLLYACRHWKHTPTPREGQMLMWKTLGEMRDLAMPAADKPLIDLLISQQSSGI